MYPTNPFTREKIDDLRLLLGEDDRSIVSVTHLQGLRETTLPTDSWRSYERSGDIAYVFLGPADKMPCTYVENDDGTVTFSVTFRRYKTAVS